MKLLVKKPVEKNICKLIMDLPERAIMKLFDDLYDESYPMNFHGKEYLKFDELCEDYPDVFRNCVDEIQMHLEVDIDSGKVLNWPTNAPLAFYDVKIVDEGTYRLLDENGEVVTSYSGYVPTCVGEWGDYLEFEINEEGYILEWEFDQDHLDEFIENEYE